ncbi:MAG: hypothetical protein JSV01_00825 [Desulfobacterales bacterium]|nr:MAG: hypothetical protein JSV01_00825 [Desulfobacterales bacterium]UCG80425.1 MAG: hypothetical protein JSV60_10775 [Desulfobacterales bacterium]
MPVKRLFADVRIIVTTRENDPNKEKSVREKEVFYYHVTGFGINELKTAISCAMPDAIQTYLPWEQVRG